jgi:hypothetical protein
MPVMEVPLVAGTDVGKLGYVGQAMAALGSLVDRIIP